MGLIVKMTIRQVGVLMGPAVKMTISRVGVFDRSSSKYDNQTGGCF